MGKSNTNGYPPKVELQLNQEVRLKILRPAKVGKNGNEPYYLYRVGDLSTGEEGSLFAPAEVHSVIQENKLGVGSEFLPKCVENGTKKGKLELSSVSTTSVEPRSDQFKEIMRQCLSEAIEITRSFADVPFQYDEMRAIGASLFIARTRLS